MRGKVVVVGAVQEALPVVERLAQDRPSDFAGLVTFEDEILREQSGWVDLSPPALAVGVPVIRVRNLNSAQSLEALARLEPDLLVVVGWTRLLREPVLRLPTFGAVGFHASLLPENRGRAPINWQILRGDVLTGNTMMQLDAGTDTGAIIDQVEIPISRDDTCATVYSRVAGTGADMLLRNLDDLLSNRAVAIPQDPRAGSENGRRTPEMGVTDWSRGVRQLHDWIRAQTRPYPGAFTTVDGRVVRLWQSSIVEEHSDGLPGEVLNVSLRGFTVQCGRGVLRIEDWQNTEGTAPAVGTVFDTVDEATRDWSLGLRERP